MPEDLRFPFSFAWPYRVAGLPFGVTPHTTLVRLTSEDLVVRFGPWRLRTPRANIAGTEESGGFAFVRTAGPAHLSLTDKGVTFATNGHRGVCIRFHEPVKALDPTGRLRHPGATVTVADPDALIRALPA